MKPTIPWMKQTFDIYNKKYFGGRLKMPYFSTNCYDNMWGYYEYNGNVAFNRKFKPKGVGKIYLNGNFSRDEKDWIGTLLHEMIHMYIAEVELKWPMILHGNDFKKWANILNQDGWNISEQNEKKESDVYDKYSSSNDNRSYEDRTVKPSIFCIINQPSDQENKFWGFRAEYETLNSYIESAKKLKNLNGATVLNIYYCYAPQVAQMPSSPTTLNGIGGLGIKNIIYKICKIYGGDFDTSYFKLYKTIEL